MAQLLSIDILNGIIIHQGEMDSEKYFSLAKTHNSSNRIVREEGHKQFEPRSLTT